MMLLVLVLVLVQLMLLVLTLFLVTALLIFGFVIDFAVPGDGLQSRKVREHTLIN